MSDANKFEEEPTVQLPNDDLDKTAEHAPLNDETLINDGDETQMAENFDFDVIQKGGKLIIISAQDNGKEFLLSKANLKLGRSDECELKLDYPGVSRQHASLSLENHKFILTDHGSKYGSFINGKKISEPTPLRPDDLVQLGELTLKYAEGSGTASHTSGGNPASVVALLLSKEHLPLKIGVVLFVLFLLMIAFRQSSRSQEKSNASSTTEFIEKTQTKNLTSQELIKAKLHAKNGDYSQALFIVEGILATDPSHDEARMLQESWRRQAALKNNLDEAEQMISLGNIDPASQKLDLILSEFPENEKAQSLKLKINQVRLSEKQTDTLREAKKLFTENRLAAAKNLLESIKDPSLEQGVNEIKQQIATREKANENLSQAENFFSEGNLEQALAKVREGIQIDPSHTQCKEMELKLENIKKYQQEAKTALNSGIPLTANEALKKIITLVPKNNPLHQQASQDLANIEAQTAILAEIEYQKVLQLMADRKYSEAFQKIDTLSTNFPDLNFIKDTKLELKVHLDNLGAALFQAGYVLEENDPIKAKDMYRKVITYLPRDHAYSLKARTKLKS